MIRKPRRSSNRPDMLYKVDGPRAIDPGDQLLRRAAVLAAPPASRPSRRATRVFTVVDGHGLGIELSRAIGL